MLRHVNIVALVACLVAYSVCLAGPVSTESQAGMRGSPGTPPGESPAVLAKSTREVTGRNLPEDEPAKAKETERQSAWDRTIPLTEKWNMVLGPDGDLYPKYIADPRRPTFAIAKMFFSETEIHDSGKSRLGLRMGTRFGLLRFHKDEDPEHGFQVDIGGGFIGQFDMDNDMDNIGWDGVYSLQVAWAPWDRLAMRVASFHVSSHVGDEYAERTGRKRVEYTREEALLGVSWGFAKRWRLYVEGAKAYTLRNKELMEPWRVQGGLEYVSPGRIWKGRLGWYAAADVSSYEENDWDTNTTIQVGLLYPLGYASRNWRLAVEYYDGRSHMGEFFQDREEYVSIGFWFDL